MNKSEIRKFYQKKRLDLTSKEIEVFSNEIADNFITNLLPKIADFAAKKIAFYKACNNEVNPNKILDFCHQSNNILALPKIANNSKILDFKQYKINDPLEKNKDYPDILEPKNEAKNIIPDIIFTPLVAFDKSCNRIGMGGGFYDATIHHFKQNHKGSIFIGLAYNMQKYQIINIDDSDQSLDFIISQNHIIKRNSVN